MGSGIVSLVMGCFRRNKRSPLVKALAVIDYLSRGSYRKTSKVVSLVMEPLSKSAIHYLAKKLASTLKLAREPKPRRCLAVDETKLRVKGAWVYVWSAVDVDSGELLALEASYGRSCLNALLFLMKALRLCSNKPMVIMDKGPWYPWALQRLGLEYKHQRFGLRNAVERFFGYLKERTSIFHHKLSARNYRQGIANLNLFLSIFSLWYAAYRGQLR